MKNLKILVLLLLGVVVTVSSCKKDDDDDDGNTNNNTGNQTCYMNKMTYEDGDYDMIAYNSSYQVIKVTSYDSNGTADGSETRFTYANNKLQTMESYDNGTIESKMELVYVNNTTPDSLVMYSDNGSGTLERDGVVTLSFNGEKIAKLEMIENVAGVDVVLFKSEFTYTGENLTMQKDYSFSFTALGLELDGTMEMEYDSKKNPLYNVGLSYLAFWSPVEFGSVNNITKLTSKDENGTVLQDESENYTYEYNTNNYPTKQSLTAFDNSYTDVTQFSYDCQ